MKSSTSSPPTKREKTVPGERNARELPVASFHVPILGIPRHRAAAHLLDRRHSLPFCSPSCCAAPPILSCATDSALVALLAILFGGLISWSALNQKVSNISAPAPQISAVASQPAPTTQATPFVQGQQPHRLSHLQPHLSIVQPSIGLHGLPSSGSSALRSCSFGYRRPGRPRPIIPPSYSNRLLIPPSSPSIEQARRQLGIVRRIRTVASEQLTSPAVMQACWCQR